jgi:hypothetical protein
VLYSTTNNNLKNDIYLVLGEFEDVILEEVPGLPPKRDIDFSIELVPVLVTTSKVTYRMRTPELMEPKIQLKEMLDKGYIRTSVSLWGAQTLFVKNKYGTL